LDPPPAVSAPSDLDVELAPDHFAGDLCLELPLELEVLELSTTARTLARQRSFENLVDSQQYPAEGLPAIVPSGLAARFLRIGNRVVLRERSGLPLHLALQLFQATTKLLVFLSECLVLPTPEG